MNDHLIKLYRTIEDDFFNAIAEKTCKFGDSAIAYMTRMPVPQLNLVYVKNNDLSLDAINNLSQDFYRQYNKPFSIIIPKNFDCNQASPNHAKQNYRLSDESTAMYCEIKNTQRYMPSNDKQINIHAANTELDDWVDLLTKAFGAEPQHGVIYTSMHKQALQKGYPLQHFVLYVKNKPVSSVTLSVKGNLARIDDVATLPDFQHQGYGTMMIKYALHVAKNLNAEYCFLEASTAGLKLYKNLGFKTLFENNIYACV